MVDAIDADTTTAVLFDILRSLNLSIAKVRGQCYDGAATMSGKNAGVVTKVLKEEHKALYTHILASPLHICFRPPCAYSHFLHSFLLLSVPSFRQIIITYLTCHIATLNYRYFINI